MDKETALAIVSSKLALIIANHRKDAVKYSSLVQYSAEAEERIIEAATVLGIGSDVLHKANLLTNN